MLNSTGILIKQEQNHFTFEFIFKYLIISTLEENEHTNTKKYL